eukprot:GILK01007872.1.p1 GENE.GILK01007872.1~~GILK01007872.1.p1  ORF type:complete len:1816 (-),score=424.36 GILK01007872.1:186-5633(-)
MPKKSDVSDDERRDEEDQEEEEEGEDVDDDDDEEEEDETLNEYENDGFIVMEGEDEDERRRKKKKKKKLKRRDKSEKVELKAEKSEDVSMKEAKEESRSPSVSEEEEEEDLDEDDYELLKENLGRTVARKKRAVDDEEDQTRLKRLKRQRMRDQEAEKIRVKTAEDLQRSLFGEGEDNEEAESHRREEVEDVNFDMEEDEDDMGDFIDDGNDKAARKQKEYARSVAASLPVHVDASQLEMAREIFGEVYSEYLSSSAQKHRAVELEDTQKEDRTFAQFEPSEIEENFATRDDETIRTTDVPERLQLRYTTRFTPTEEELEAESRWLLQELKQIRSDSTVKVYSDVESREKVYEVLKLLRVLKLEPPFITTYRRQIYEPVFTGQDVWDMYKLDEKWGGLWNVQSSIQKQLAQAEVGSSEILAELLDQVPQCGRPEELQDLQEYIDAHLSSGTHSRGRQAQDEGDEEDDTTHTTSGGSGGSSLKDKVKRPVKRDLLRMARKAQLHVLGEKLGLSPRQLAENVVAGWQMHKTPACTDKPQELAMQFVSTAFPDIGAVLLGLVRFVAKEISCEPKLRQYIRRVYMDKVTVTTAPTSVGKKELDVFHPSYRVKNFFQMPTSQFTGDLYLDLEQCEERALITVRFELPTDYSGEDRILQELEKAYLFEGPEDPESISIQWNVIRKEILRACLSIFLYPLFEREVRHRLLEDAKDYVAKQAAQTLKTVINAGPYRPKRRTKYDTDESDSDSDADSDSDGGGKRRKKTKKKDRKSRDERKEKERRARVLACMVDTDGSALPKTYLVMLDRDGEVVDHLVLSFLFARSGDYASVTERSRHSTDWSKLKQFMVEQEPHAVVIGANGMRVNEFKKNVRNLAIELAADAAGNEDAIENAAWVTWGEVEVPRVFANSKRGAKMYPDYPPLLRQAISLGRKMQDPLAETLGLALDKERTGLLSLNLHPLQHRVGDAKLLDAFSAVAQQVTASVGVDINRILAHPHLAGPLQFVSGLGPRKAAHLLQTLSRSGRSLEMRLELMTLRYMETSVYTNAAGFIKVKLERAYVGSEEEVDVLDSTRIHPESYELATKIAGDALEAEDDNDQNSWVEQVMRSPEKLNDLDLQAFADHLASRGTPNMKIVLDFIVQELQHPFADPRPPYEDIPMERLFYMLTGETPSTFRVGSIVPVSITKKNRGGFFVRLDNGVRGFVKNGDFSDHLSPDQVADYEPEEVHMLGRVISIEMADFKANLTLKSSDLRNHRAYVDMHSFGEYFLHSKEDMEEAEPKEDKTAKSKKTKAFVPRSINHPLFHNWSMRKTLQHLADKDQGEAVVRPSSKGTSNLTLTWKFYDDSYVHVDIEEKSRDKNTTTIGKKLVINGREYADLDELSARYVERCATYARDMMEHEKFTDVGVTELEAKAKADKAAAPKRIWYQVTIDPRYPGYFLLCVMPHDTFRIEYIKVVPEGYRFRTITHRSPLELFNWWKKNFANPQYPPDKKPPVPVTQKEDEEEEQRQQQPSSSFASRAPPSSWAQPSGGYGNDNGSWHGADSKGPGSSWDSVPASVPMRVATPNYSQDSEGGWGTFSGAQFSQAAAPTTGATGANAMDSWPDHHLPSSLGAAPQYGSNDRRPFEDSRFGDNGYGERGGRGRGYDAGHDRRSDYRTDYESSGGSRGDWSSAPPARAPPSSWDEPVGGSAMNQPAVSGWDVPVAESGMGSRASRDWNVPRPAPPSRGYSPARDSRSDSQIDSSSVRKTGANSIQVRWQPNKSAGTGTAAPAVASWDAPVAGTASSQAVPMDVEEDSWAKPLSAPPAEDTSNVHRAADAPSGW